MDNSLNTQLLQHELWLNTQGKEGMQLLVKEKNLSSLSLPNRDLSNSAFLDVRLDSADLSNTNFAYSNLGYSSFKRANLSGVTLVKAEADHADFEGAVFNHSNAFRSTFIGASFRGAALIGVNFSRCLLDDSDFSNAKISGCRFYEADLSKIKGLDSVVLDWIDVGKEDNPQKLFGIEGVKWLQEASMK